MLLLLDLLPPTRRRRDVLEKVDFNNMLMVVLGNLQMLESTEIDSRARHYADAAIQGTDRASALTARLLA